LVGCGFLKLFGWGLRKLVEWFWKEAPAWWFWKLFPCCCDWKFAATTWSCWLCVFTGVSLVCGGTL
jgi:hypothetical protein